ncbi:winged helix-turn-helix transcriptional regulator, partial [bacterium]|nr:winged helix-turn-helix transcriptional regulator [bacterium]
MLNSKSENADAAVETERTVAVDHGERTLSSVVRELHRSFARALQRRIASHGVSMGQWFFLRVLWERDGLTQRELSQRVGMMEPTTVTAVSSMERRGFVRRVRNPHDGRKVNIFLTDKGRGLRDVLLPCAAELEEAALRGVAPADAERTLTVLLKVIENVGLPASFIDDE